jgi:hypothetical protein
MERVACKQIYLWFEFRKLAARMARYDGLIAENEHKFTDWGDIEKTLFEDWWPERSQLFEIDFVVEGPADHREDLLVIAIPPSADDQETLRQVKRLISDRRSSEAARASKKSLYKLSETARGKFDVKAAEDALLIRRDVFHSRPIGAWEGSPEMIVEHFKKIGRKPHRGLHSGDTDGELRVLRLFLRFSRYLMEQAVVGDFPGPTAKLRNAKERFFPSEETM